MIAPFDLFRTDAGGHLRWIQAAEDLDSAKAHIRALGKSSPGTYMILSQKTGNRLMLQVDADGKVEESVARRRNHGEGASNN